MDCGYIYLFEMTKKKHLIFNIGFKLIVCVLLLLLINSFLFQDDTFTNAFKEFDYNIVFENVGYGVLILCLMPINWLLESYKWKVALNSMHQKISMGTAIKSVFVGITLGIITPARVGEYVGRALSVSNEKNASAYMSTFVCSLAQNVINILLGLIAIITFVEMLNFEIDKNYVIVINVIAVILGLVIYFKINAVLRLGRSVPYLKKYLNKIQDHSFQPKLLVSILSISFVRYFVYLCQFIFALKLFGLDTSMLNFLSSIGTVFFIQSSIPIPPILDLFARGEIAIVIFGMLKFNLAGILMASGLLWGINLILPAFIGLFLLLKVNVLKSIGLEKKNDI